MLSSESLCACPYLYLRLWPCLPVSTTACCSYKCRRNRSGDHRRRAASTTRRRAERRFEQQLGGQQYTAAEQTSGLTEPHTPTRRQLAQQRFMHRHQSAPSSTNEHSRQQTTRVAALWDVFRAFDLDGSGGIERGELMQLGQARRMLGQKEGCWSWSQNERLVASLGGAQDGKVGGASFVEYFERVLAGLSAAEFDSTIKQFTEVAVSCHQAGQSPNAAYSYSNNGAWPHISTAHMADGQPPSNRSTYTSSYPSDPRAGLGKSNGNSRLNTREQARQRFMEQVIK